MRATNNKWAQLRLCERPAAPVQYASKQARVSGSRFVRFVVQNEWNKGSEEGLIIHLLPSFPWMIDQKYYVFIHIEMP